MFVNFILKGLISKSTVICMVLFDGHSKTVSMSFIGSFCSKGGFKGLIFLQINKTIARRMIYKDCSSVKSLACKETTHLGNKAWRLRRHCIDTSVVTGIRFRSRSNMVMFLSFGTPRTAVAFAENT